MTLSINPLYSRKTLAHDARTRMWPDARFLTSAYGQEILPGIFHYRFDIAGYDLCDRIDQYVVIDGGEALFFDVGYWEVCGTSALDEVDLLSSCLLSKKSAFISHFHDDHAGNIPYVEAQGFDAVYHVSRAAFDDAVLRDFVTVTGWSLVSQELSSGLFHMRNEKDSGESKMLDVSESLEAPEVIGKALWDNNVLASYQGIVVDDKDCIQVGNRAFEVIKTPGHSPDHASLLEREQGILFGGDHILDAGPGIIQFAPQQHLVSRYLESLNKLESCNLRAILPAHNDPYIGEEAVAHILATTRAFFVKSLDKRLQLVQENPGASAIEIMMAQKGREDFLARPLRHRARAVAATYAYLEALCDQGKLCRSQGSDGVERFSVME